MPILFNKCSANCNCYNLMLMYLLQTYINYFIFLFTVSMLLFTHLTVVLWSWVLIILTLYWHILNKVCTIHTIIKA